MSDQPTRDPVIDLLDATQRETQDLVTAICQVHTDRVHDLLSRDMRGQVMQIIDERFSQLELSLRPRMARARLEVARGVTQVLSDCFARMRRFESDRHWCDALLDATGAMSRRSAFFSVRAERLCFQGSRGFSGPLHAPAAEVPYKDAPAFDRVLSTGEMAMTSRGAADLSRDIAELFGNDAEGRALLVPVTVESRVPGVIYAEDPVDPTAMQAVATMAGAVLERHLRLEPQRAATGAVRVAVTPFPPQASTPEQQPGAGTASPGAARARRFAKVEVARMLLAHEQRVSDGRACGDLYGALRHPIDAARSAYRARFDGEDDFLHEELVHTLARGNPSLLGGGYPGPLA